MVLSPRDLKLLRRLGSRADMLVTEVLEARELSQSDYKKASLLWIGVVVINDRMGNKLMNNSELTKLAL